MNIQLTGAVTNQPPLKILFISDTDNNKALDCGLQSYFFYPSLLNQLVTIYTQRVCNSTAEVQGLTPLVVHTDITLCESLLLRKLIHHFTQERRICFIKLILLFCVISIQL
jgi:hypothetical protein